MTSREDDPSPLTRLTEAAVAAFRTRSSTGWYLNSGLSALQDPVLNQVMEVSSLNPGATSVADATKALFADPELSHLRHTEDQDDPFILHAGGGVRASDQQMVTGMFNSASIEMYLLGLPNDEATFARLVLERYEELRRAARGERIRAYDLLGFAGMRLPPSAQVTTPWGVLRNAPVASTPRVITWQPETACVLASPRLLTVVFDRAPEPKHEFDPSEIQANQRVTRLLPLACAVASADDQPVAPQATWSTTLLPFVGVIGWSLPNYAGPPKPVIDLGSRISSVEHWARIIDSEHTPAADIAARRAVSAISLRQDRSDALIDAVMVWENLVGTGSEVSFRVTAAIAKLLEPDLEKRLVFRKRLSEIYRVRSQVVHGGPVAESEVHESATDAIAIAIRSLRASYERGSSWLSLTSNERADQLLLKEP